LPDGPGIRGRPLIALVGGVKTRDREPELTVPASYLEAVERAGGEPVVLFPVELVREAARERLRPFAGLVLTGGADIDPTAYGQSPGPHLYGVDQVRDAFEIELVHAAVDIGLPVLAICRGLQVLNVARGGTLDQHITGRDDLESHGVPGGGEPVLHAVRVERASKLAAVMQAERVESSCHHHQAVASVGQGLRPVAWADDGVIEGLEGEPGWLMAVQWHPEDTAARDPAQQRLFDALVEQASNPRAD
jgi:putative glutamine amidotransferase